MIASTVVSFCSLFISYNVHSSFIELDQKPFSISLPAPQEGTFSCTFQVPCFAVTTYNYAGTVGGNL